MPIDPQSLPVPDLGLCCKRCGYILTGLSEHCCPECGQEFDLDEYVPAGAYPPLWVEGKLVQPSAEVIDLLERYGIPLASSVDAMDQAFGFTFSAVGRVNVTVPRDCYWDAVDLVRRLWHGQPMPPEPPPPPEGEHGGEQAEWACAGCGEENPGNFDVCWSCGETRADR